MWWERLTLQEVSLAGFVRSVGHREPPALDRILIARARQCPLVLLLDEAHTLDLGRV